MKYLCLFYDLKSMHYYEFCTGPRELLFERGKAKASLKRRGTCVRSRTRRHSPSLRDHATTTKPTQQTSTPRRARSEKQQNQRAPAAATRPGRGRRRRTRRHRQRRRTAAKPTAPARKRTLRDHRPRGDGLVSPSHGSARAARQAEQSAASRHLRGQQGQ